MTSCEMPQIRISNPGELIETVPYLLGFHPSQSLVLIGFVYAHYGEIDALRRFLAGISAAAAGLVIATTAKMAKPLIQRWSFAPLIALTAFATVGVLRWSLPLTLLVLAPLSVGLAWWTRR